MLCAFLTLCLKTSTTTLTRTVKLIGLSRCLQIICALQTTMYKKINQSVSPASDKNSYTLTRYPAVNNIVPRHSINSDSLYPDCKHRAMLRSFRLCDSTLLVTEELWWSQPPFAQQRLLNFTAGPLGCIAHPSFQFV
jgi:hypothetical protein